MEATSKEKGEKGSRLGSMASTRWISGLVAGLCLWSGTTWAETGFDPKYERDYNIFHPMHESRLDNPANPINQGDLRNPVNPINRFNLNNPLNPMNVFRPDNPLNPINRENPRAPFRPVEGSKQPK